MSRSTGRHGWTLVTAVMALSAFLGVAHAQGSEATLSNARLRQPRDRAFLTSAIRGAARRMGDPRCQELLGELRDRSRRPLREALEAEGVSAPEFLDRLYFYDGTESGLRRPQACVHGARLPRRVRLQQPIPRLVPAEHQPGRGRGRPRGAALPRPRREPSHAAGDQCPGAGSLPGVRGPGATGRRRPGSNGSWNPVGRSGSWRHISRSVLAPLGRNTAGAVRDPRPRRGRGDG